MPPPAPKVKDALKAQDVPNTLINIEWEAHNIRKEAHSVNALWVECQAELQELKSKASDSDAIHASNLARINELQDVLKATEAEGQELKNKSGIRFEKEAAVIELKRVREENKTLKEALGRCGTIPTDNLNTSNQLQGVQELEAFRVDVRRSVNELRRGVKALIEMYFDLTKDPSAAGDDGANPHSKDQDGHLTTINALEFFYEWNWNTAFMCDRRALINGRIYRFLHTEFFSKPLFGFNEAERAGGNQAVSKIEETLRYYERLLLAKKVAPGKVADWVRMTIASAQEMSSYYRHARGQHPTRIANHMVDYFYPLLKGATYEKKIKGLRRMDEICVQAVDLVLKVRKGRDRWVFVSWDDYDTLKDVPYDIDALFNTVGFQGEEELKPGMWGSDIALQMFGGLCYHERREDDTFEEQGHVVARTRCIYDLDENWKEGDEPPRKKVKTES
ncbi:hypothetical protein QBC37DRAFT_460488 [Rhypophila decipiens]|uniref:Uncharacterized protein n=1 Tax=Rhypophila decipiens TaxID=261697 RepID=A0AAN7B927_9PEZI|nr:hypothetical protein QBC37DRAFT_460488 [Rhypophila decipiens]